MGAHATTYAKNDRLLAMHSDAGSSVQGQVAAAPRQEQRYGEYNPNIKSWVLGKVHSRSPHTSHGVSGHSAARPRVQVQVFVSTQVHRVRIPGAPRSPRVLRAPASRCFQRVPANILGRECVRDSWRQHIPCSEESVEYSAENVEAMW